MSLQAGPLLVKKESITLLVGLKMLIICITMYNLDLLKMLGKYNILYSQMLVKNCDFPWHQLNKSKSKVTLPLGFQSPSEDVYGSNKKRPKRPDMSRYLEDSQVSHQLENPERKKQNNLYKS